MPLCVFDIFEDGTAQVPDDDQLTGPGRYRWWHYDLSDPALAPWLADHLPEIPAGALLQPEPRPRREEHDLSPKPPPPRPRLSITGLAAGTAVIGIVIAAATNNLVKSGLAGFVGNRQTGFLVGIPMVFSLAAGLLVAWLQ